MSEPTTTRAALRRAICAELQMPFFRRFSAGVLTMDSTSTTSKLIDATLMQKDKFWDNGWLFIPSTGEISIIRSFSANEHSAHLEVPLAAASDSDSNPFAYEIQAMWNALEIHSAINRAIELGSRIFPETVVDMTLVVKENVLSYSLTGLTRPVMMLNKVWIENPATLIHGTATAGAATSITLQSVPSNITTTWKISIYAGTGAGQIRDYVSNVGNVVTVLAWVTNPDSTSKYAVWNAAEEIYDWIPAHTIYTDAKEYPDSLRFRSPLYPYYGCRIRLEYLSAPLPLSLETDATIVPKEYVLPKACALLHGQRINDTRADRDLHFAENQRYDQMAEAYALKNAPHVPDSSIRAQFDASTIGSAEDPLNWRNM